METLKDHLYLWCHNAGVYDPTADYTPLEGAAYMGIENITMVVYDGKPIPPFEKIQEKLDSLKKVVWSICGAVPSARETPLADLDRETSLADLDEVIRLHRTHKNVTGGIMDDFFCGTRKFDFLEISRRTHEANLPLWVVLYTNQFDREGIWEQLELCDVVNLWTWESDDIAKLEENMAFLKKKMPHKKIALGCYLWNFNRSCEISVDPMRHQCSLGLKWLKDGTISDLVILGSPLIGLDLATIKWTRNWIAENKDTPLAK